MIHVAHKSFFYLGPLAPVKASFGLASALLPDDICLEN